MARTISALILIPVSLLVVIYATPAYLLVGIGLVGTACLYEYFGLIRAMGIQAQPWFGYAGFWILLVASRVSKISLATLLTFVLIAAFLVAMGRRKRSARERAMGLLAEAFGILYFTLFLCPALAIRYDFGKEIGLQWSVILLIVIWAGDSCALVAGKTLGRTPFAAVLSPKKTNEGALAGLFACIAAGAVMQHFFFAGLPLSHVIAVSILLGIFGQLGDLAESMLKRAAEIKDSSHLIPGHGGVLDRMDSLLFGIPVLYLYLLNLYK